MCPQHFAKETNHRSAVIHTVNINILNLYQEIDEWRWENRLDTRARKQGVAVSDAGKFSRYFVHRSERRWHSKGHHHHTTNTAKSQTFSKQLSVSTPPFLVRSDQPSNERLPGPQSRYKEEEIAELYHMTTNGAEGLLCCLEVHRKGTLKEVLRWLATPDQDSEWHIQHCVTFYESIASVFVIMKDETRCYPVKMLMLSEGSHKRQTILLTTGPVSEASIRGMKSTKDGLKRYNYQCNTVSVTKNFIKKEHGAHKLYLARLEEEN
uniref:Uncharacterized protein n=1 Tax=Timema tahoe TaxID=61484 RepID=A0A7R9IC01_9NEOP|nr:unnamed protein product [Timema tahoe]